MALTLDDEVTARAGEQLAPVVAVMTLMTRSRLAAMPEAEYERELERLLVAIAERTQAIRAAGGKP